MINQLDQLLFEAEFSTSDIDLSACFAEISYNIVTNIAELRLYGVEDSRGRDLGLVCAMHLKKPRSIKLRHYSKDGEIAAINELVDCRLVDHSTHLSYESNSGPLSHYLQVEFDFLKIHPLSD